MAQFFTAYAFNYPLHSDCVFVDQNNLSCENGGMTMSSCQEWNSPMFFNVSIELDWARTYWDLITDERQPFYDYLVAEEGVTGWNRVNHIQKIEAAYGAAFTRAKAQNMHDGGVPPH
jgi:hypothetical protein